PIYVAFEDDSMVGIFNVLSDVMFQKSTDAGRTWLPTDVLVRDGDPHAYDPDIATDSDGNIYIVWEDWYIDTAGGHYHRILCSRSSDGGTTWTAPARVDDRPDPTKWGIGGPRIAADSGGNLLCAWDDERVGSEGNIWSSVSTDRGATWSRNVRVDDDTTDEGVCRADVVVQPGTNHYLVAAQTPRRVGSHWEAGAALYRSTDMGLTFQPGVQIDTSRYDTRHPHIAADRDHIICDYFSQPYRVGDTMIVEARMFYTQADSWGTPARMTNLDSLHELYYSGHLAISGDGGVHTALMVQDTFDGDDNIYYTSSSDHGVSWSDLELVSDDTTVESWYPDIGADSAGHAYIVWYQPNASRGEIWFATNAPLGIAEGTPNAELRAPNSGPTVVRGVMYLPRSLDPSVPTCLLDISGREVMDLKPGANDVSLLSPGVYFVREAQAQAQAQAVRKIVVTR
ncbi:MAG: exo-alpha-sialidase, partial [Candidatus Eisenbacteria bacterium]|nr:exo-alpha-sialidase [Candidatus Eisenbacteria bacterium]